MAGQHILCEQINYSTFRLRLFAMVKELQQRVALYNDMEAYKQLYELFFSPLYRFSYSIIKSKEAAEEIVSDVFIKIWEMRQELHKVNELNVYLYVVTKNYSLNYITRTFKNPVVCLDEIEVESLFSLPSPEEMLITADMNKRIIRAVSELPSQCRLIFQLVKEDGLKYKEVAAILNISVLTVRNQVAIATKKIAAALPVNTSAIHSRSRRLSGS